MDEFELEFDLIGEEPGPASGIDADRLLGHIRRGELETAAHLYEQHADEALGRALIEGGGQDPALLEQIARTLESAREFALAGRAREAAGDAVAAATLYEAGRDYEHAASAFEQAGDLRHAALALGRSGQLLEAARRWERLGDAVQEVQALRAIPEDHADYPAAVRRLLELMDQHQRPHDAAQLLSHALRASGAVRADARFAARLVALLQQLGRPDEAAAVEGWRAQVHGPTDVVVSLEDEVIQGTPIPADPPAPAKAEAPVLADDEGEEGIFADELSAMAVAEGRQNPFEEAQRAREKSPVAYRTLKGIPMFAELSLVDMKDLYRLAEDLEYPAGAVLIEDGQAAPGLLVVVEGTVEITAGGRTLNTVGAGAHLGEISLVRDAPASARATAQGPVRALLIAKERMDEFLYSHPEAAVRIYRLFCISLAERVAALS